MNRFLLASFLIIFSHSSCAFADAPSLSIKLTYPKNGKTFSAALIPSQEVSGCTFQLYGSTSNAKIAALNPSTLLVSSTSDSPGPFIFTAKHLKTLSSSVRLRRLAFRGQLICPDGTSSSSSVLKITPKSDSSGLKSIDAWIKHLKVRLTVGQLSIAEAFPNLSFTAPIDLQNAADGTNRLFVAQQTGQIYVFTNASTTTTKTLFLDISSKLIYGGERGLLGFAFHPDFKKNGLFFVHYSKIGTGDTVIARYKVSTTDSNLADPASELVILEQPQPFPNHNGGQITFGKDGFLYIALGDGGSAGDPFKNGQNKTVLLAKILRIDIDNTQGSANYAIPSDNPFKGSTDGTREEIFAYGLRNPWRISFDSQTNKLWVGDVGQNLIEEIDVVEKGKNYGWNTMEASSCYNATTCDTTGLELPVTEYDHTVGKSITGGFVYRGTKTPTLNGLYIFADFVTGRLFALDSALTTKTYSELFDTNDNISSFGVDESKELYFLSYNRGVILKLQ